MAVSPIRSKKPLTAHEIGWLAGIVDGEGSLYLKLESNRKRYPVLQVEMTDYSTLVQVYNLLKRFGTPRWLNIPARNRTRNRPAYRVTLRRPESILAFLGTVGKHLVTKRPQAATAKQAARNNIHLREKRQAQWKEAA